MSTWNPIQDQQDAEYWEIVQSCIRKRRIKTGLSQEQLAKLAGISREQQWRLERNFLQARIDSLMCCCRVFGISMLELLVEASRCKMERLIHRMSRDHPN
jgi:transcriptional regulator with XRE-family HTH domain